MTDALAKTALDTDPPTWQLLCDLEPRLGALESLVMLAKTAAGGDPDYVVFLTAVKPLLVALVGWARGDLTPTRDTVEDTEAGKLRVYTLAELMLEQTRRRPTPTDEVEVLLHSSAAYDVAYNHLNGLLDT